MKGGAKEMIDYEEIIKSQRVIVEAWGENGKRVIEACLHATPFNGSFDKFLSHCTCCGGNWGGMLLSGINAVASEVWDAIPEELGFNAFGAICAVLVLIGVDQ